MAVNTRYRRASAIAVAQPWIWTVHTDTTNGVDDEERWAAAWAYIGISIGIAAALGRKRGLLLGVYP